MLSKHCFTNSGTVYTLKTVIERALWNLSDGDSIMHEQDGIVYSIVKHIASGVWYSYWENGSCMIADLTLEQAIDVFLGEC